MKAHPPTGRSLRIRRIELGLSLEYVAKASGVDKSNLSKLERGLIGSTPKTLKALSDTLDMSMDELAPELAAMRAESS